MAFIYSALCKSNGKRYIGFTTNLENRKREHKYISGSIIHEYYNLLFYKAIRKYGWDNFAWEILYTSKNDEICLEIMEPYFIKLYDSLVPNGYNISEGGNRGPRMPGEKNPWYGKKRPEHANLLRGRKRPELSQRMAGENNPNFGKGRHHNKPEEIFECYHCHKYYRASNLVQHLNRLHLEIPKWQ